MFDSAVPLAMVTCNPDIVLSMATTSNTFIWQRHAWADSDQTRDAQAIVDEIARAVPGVVCIAADVPEALALEISRLFDELHHDIGVLLIRPPYSALWRDAARVGVRDIIDPENLARELFPAAERAYERGQRLRASLPAAVEPMVPHGKIIVVLSPKGGSGKTMLATNLAVALASTNSGETVVVDLDSSFGDVAGSLGILPEHTVGQLATLPSFDSTTLKVYLNRHEASGTYVLAGSELPEEGEALTDKLVPKILDMLAIEFDYVIVDTAAGLDERALAAIETATDLVFIATLDVASVRNLGKELNALDRLAMPTVKRHFVLNRADARAGLDIGGVESVIGMSVDAAIPSSILVPVSMNHGTAVVLDEPKSDVAKELVAFARRFAPTASATASTTATRKGRQSLWRR